MKHIYLLACALGLYHACDGQTPVQIPVINTEVVDDPYFIVTRDTISTTGPISITRNMLQDTRGRYWFATWQGIMCYDGKQFINRTLKDSLRKYHVFAMTEDSRGNIWFGTIRGGVYQYDAARDAFTLLNTQNGLINDIIGCFLEDRDGNIWIGTDEGVSVYSYLTHTITNYTAADGLSGTSINGMAEDQTGRIWFAARGGEGSGVSYFTPGEKRHDGKVITEFTHPALPQFNNARSVIEDRQGILWIGGQDGLFQYYPKTNELIKIMPNFIGYITEDSEGILWLSHGQSEGNGMVLARFDPSTRDHRIVHTDQQVFGTTEDAEGNIWFGTLHGAMRYDRKTGVITQL